MSISLKQALLFVPGNEKWVQHVLVGGLLLFFPTFAYIFPGLRRLIFIEPINYYALALFLMFSAVVFLAVTGYFFKAIHNRVVHDKEGLPGLKHFSYYVFVGFKAYLGGFIFSVPFLLFLLILFTFAPMGITKELIPFALTAGVVHIIYSFLYIMLALNFALNFKISSFWNFKKAYALISGNMSNFVILVFYCLVLAAAHTLITAILINAQILALLIPFVSFYVYLVYTDLFAQFILNKEKVLTNEKECLI